MGTPSDLRRPRSACPTWGHTETGASPPGWWAPVWTLQTRPADAGTGLADRPGRPPVSEVRGPQVGGPAAREGLRGKLPHLRCRQQDRSLPQRLGECLGAVT